jgi:hypothetical protein
MKIFVFLFSLFLTIVLLTSSCKKSDCNECAAPGWSFSANGHDYSGYVNEVGIGTFSIGFYMVGYDNACPPDTSVFAFTILIPSVSHSLTNTTCDTVDFSYIQNCQVPASQGSYNSNGFVDHSYQNTGLKAIISNYDASSGYLSVHFSGSVFLIRDTLTGQLVNISNGNLVTNVHH